MRKNDLHGISKAGPYSDYGTHCQHARTVSNYDTYEKDRILTIGNYNYIYLLTEQIVTMNGFSEHEKCRILHTLEKNCYGYIVTVDRSCTFGNALVSIGTSSTGFSPPSALYSFACPELTIIHKANTVSTTGDLLLLLTSHLQGLHSRCSGSNTELGTDREAAIIRSVAALCRLGSCHLPLCTMHTRLRVLPQEWLETTQTHIDIGSASIPSLPIRNIFTRYATSLGFARISHNIENPSEQRP